MAPIRFEARSPGEVRVVDAESLFAEAQAAYSAKHFADASALYDRVWREFSVSALGRAARYNAGLAYEAANDFAAAKQRYQLLLGDPAATQCSTGCRDFIDARFRLGGALLELKQFAEAEKHYADLLKHGDLTVGDRLEAIGRHGVACFELHRPSEAEKDFRAVLRLYRQSETLERVESDYFVGLAGFYLGELARQNYRALPLRLPEKQLEKDFEAKAEALLQAQARYLDAMRLDNAEWAVAAGFRIGKLYEEFYQDFVTAPVPSKLADEDRLIYLEEVRQRVRVLLEKAVRFHEKNVLMAERIGAQNRWAKQSNEQLEKLRQLLVPLQTSPTPIAPAPEPALPGKRQDEPHHIL